MLGDELFVLLSGEVQVAINGNVIRTLSKTGIALGEKALTTRDGHTVGVSTLGPM